MTTAASTPDNAIPPASSTGRTKTITVTPSFTVRHVRVWAALTHAGPATELGISLTSPGPSPVTRTVIAGATTVDIGGQLVCYSDDVLGDIAATSENLIAFYGRNSAGTWTLKVWNPIGSHTGTFDAFGLELT